MDRRTRFLAIAAPLTVIAAILILMALVVVTRAQTLSRATSPDGRWTVVVEGSPRFLGAGGIEVTLNGFSSGGRSFSQGVIDQCRDWGEAWARYGRITVTDDHAKLYDRVIVFARHE